MNKVQVALNTYVMPEHDALAQDFQEAWRTAAMTLLLYISSFPVSVQFWSTLVALLRASGECAIRFVHHVYTMHVICFTGILAAPAAGLRPLLCLS
jgi:hypothetical protein